MGEGTDKVAKVGVLVVGCVEGVGNPAEKVDVIVVLYRLPDMPASQRPRACTRVYMYSVDVCLHVCMYTGISRD